MNFQQAAEKIENARLYRRAKLLDFEPAWGLPQYYEERVDMPIDFAEKTHGELGIPTPVGEIIDAICINVRHNWTIRGLSNQQWAAQVVLQLNEGKDYTNTVAEFRQRLGLGDETLHDAIRVWCGVYASREARKQTEPFSVKQSELFYSKLIEAASVLEEMI